MPQHPTPAPHLAVIGGGTMASTIVRGGADAGVLDPARVVVADPVAARRAAFLNAVPSAADALAWLASREPAAGVGMVLLAVKPQSLPAAAADLASHRRVLAGRLVVSILAGTPGRTIAAALAAPVRIVRVMPNTPAAIGLGMSAIAASDGAGAADVEAVRAIFGAIGKTITIDESLMDAFTAVAGSGPAYLFYLAEAMHRAATDLGLTPADADTAVRQTLLGAATLLAQRDDASPADLRAAVTSKNGTTQAATDALDAHDVMAAFRAALTAARDRGVELAR